MSFVSKKIDFKGTCIEVRSLGRGVKNIVLKRPDIHNAFNAAMISELTTALSELAAIRDAMEMRVLVLSGEGSSFCAGADLNYMKAQATQTQNENMNDARTLGQMFFKLACFPTTVVGVAQGAAIGGGLGLLACSDFVLAESKTVFATSEVLLGIVPAVISPYIVRRIGLANATPFMLSGRRFKADEAHRLGLVQKVCDASELAAETDAALEMFLKGGPNAVRRTKMLLRKVSPLPTQEVFQTTCQVIADARASDEGRLGLASFFEKSTPDWQKVDEA